MFFHELVLSTAYEILKVPYNFIELKLKSKHKSFNLNDSQKKRGGEGGRDEEVLKSLKNNKLSSRVL